MLIMNTTIKEKPHRLAREYYKGTSIVAFTMCIKDRVEIFKNPAVAEIFISFLTNLAEKYQCKIPVYCFMPDHVHMMITGIDSELDLLKVASSFKQKTGFWMAKYLSGAKWQKNFYDHVIKRDESLSTHIRYILDNPVRKGIVSNWQEYPFKGAIGYELEDILHGLM